MEIIAQFIENLNALNKSIFIILSNLEPLSLNNKVSKDLQALLDNPELNELLKLLNSNSISFNSLLNPIAKLAKEETITSRWSLKELPYANFIIDEPPLVKDHSNAIIEQLSFEDILANSDKEIKPVKRRIDISYKGSCPYCSAPNEYLYENSNGKQYLCKCCDNLFTIHSRGVNFKLSIGVKFNLTKAVIF